MPPFWVWNLAATLLAAFAMFLVTRSVSRVDAIEKRQQDQDNRVHQIELQMVKELATKDDVTEVKRYVESVAATLGEIRDMVIRLDAQKDSHR